MTEALRKISLKYLLVDGGTFVPPYQDGFDITYIQPYEIRK